MNARWTRDRSVQALVTAAAAAMVMTMAACGGSEATSGVADTPSGAASAMSTPSSPSTPTATPTPAGQSASDGFRTWLAASRQPDAQTACAGLSAAQIKRMLAELQGAASSCPEMITMTAAAYQVTGQSADVDIEVRSETATEATLFVTYEGSQKCGTVVMERSASRWVITEQSEQCRR